MAKLVKYIFIPILFVFLMSHNASAIDASINLNDYEVVPISVDPGYYDYVFDTPNYSCSQAFNCTFRYGARLKQASTHSYYDLKKGDIVTYQLYIFSTSTLDILLSNLQIRPITPGYGASLLYIHQVSNTNLHIGGGTIGGYNTGVVYEIAIKYDRDGSYRLGSFNTNTIDIVLDGGLNNTDGSGATIAITGFSLYRYSGSSVNKEQSQATQDASDASETAGGSSASSSQQGTASLISTIGSAVSVITSASPTNCLLNGNMGNLDVGQIDLCANPVPTFVQVIGSIILILMVVPLCITLFNRFIGLFRSFQS